MKMKRLVNSLNSRLVAFIIPRKIISYWIMLVK